MSAAYPDWVRSLRFGDFLSMLRDRAGRNEPPELESLGQGDPELLAMAREAWDEVRREEAARNGQAPIWSADELLDYARRYLRLQGLDVRSVAGEGGHGVVFEAYDEQLERRVAVKTVHPKNRGLPGIVERLVREAKITGRLDHPGIVPIYAILDARKGSESGASVASVRTSTGGDSRSAEPCYVMRFVPQSRLDRQIRDFHASLDRWDANERRRREYRALLTRFVDACHAVAYAHSRNVIHRDLKPANIIIGGFGETLVCDWGICRVLVDTPLADARHSTIPPSLAAMGNESSTRGIGTPGFAPPEQENLLTSENIRPQADVYALGATLHQILTGRTPNGRLAPAERFLDFPADTPERLRAIVARATHPLATQRYVGEREKLWYEGLAVSPVAPGGEPPLGGVQLLLRDVQAWLDTASEELVTRPVRQDLARIERELAGRTQELATAQATWRRRLRYVSLTTALLAVGALILSFVIMMSLAPTVRRQVAEVRRLSQELDVVARERDAAQRDVAAAKNESAEVEVLLRSAEERRESVESRLRDRESLVLGEALRQEGDGQQTRAQKQLDLLVHPATFIWNHAELGAETPPPRRLEFAGSDIPSFRGPARLVVYTPDGARLVTFGDERIVWWDVATGKPTRQAWLRPAGPSPGVIGINYEVLEDRIRIVGVVPGMAASQISPPLAPGDQIVAIGDSSDDLRAVAGRPAKEALRALGGAPDTLVHLQVRREAEPDRVVSVRRQRSPIPMNVHRRSKFSPDARRLAIADLDDPAGLAVRVFDTSTGVTLATFPVGPAGGEADLCAVDFSSDGRRLLLAHVQAPEAQPPSPTLAAAESAKKYVVRVLDLDTPADAASERKMAITSPLSPTGLAFTADGQGVFGFGLGRFVGHGRWDFLTTGPASELPEMRSDGAVRHHAASADGKWFVCANADSQPLVHYGMGRMQVLRLETPLDVRAIRFSLDGRFLAVASGREAALFLTDGWTRAATIALDADAVADAVAEADDWRPVVERGVQDLAIAPDNLRLACATDSGIEVVSLEAVWNPPHRKEIGTLDRAPTAWKYQADGSAWMAVGRRDAARETPVTHVAVGKLDRELNRVRTIVDNRVQWLPPPSMSLDGEAVFVGYAAPDPRVERFRIEGPVPRSEWIRSLDPARRGGQPVARVAGQLSQDRSLVVHVDHLFQPGERRTQIPERLFRIDGQDFSASLLATTRIVQRVYPSGRSLSYRSEGFSPVADLRISETPAGPFTAVLDQRVLRAELSDDGHHLAALVGSRDESEFEGDTRAGRLTLFEYPSLRQLARWESPVSMLLDNCLNVSADGRLVAAGSAADGRLVVWAPFENRVVYDSRITRELLAAKPAGTPAVTGICFNADASRLLVSAVDIREAIHGSNLHAQQSGSPGIVAELDLQAVPPRLEVLASKQGLIGLGLPSLDRRRVPAANFVTGEITVWDFTQRKSIAMFPAGGARNADPSWQELNSIQAVAVTADDRQVAIAGPLREPAKTYRVVVLDGGDGHVLGHADLAAERIDDLTWTDDALYVLFHSPDIPESSATPRVAGIAKWLGVTAQSPWEIRPAATLSSAIQLSVFGANLPKFSPDGRRFALSVAEGKHQTVAIHETATAREVARAPLPPHAPLDAMAMRQFQWNADSSLVLSWEDVQPGPPPILHARRLALWRPDSPAKLEVITLNDPGVIMHAVASSDGDAIAFADVESDDVRLYSRRARRVVGTVRVPSSATIQDLQFSPDGTQLVVLGLGRTEALIGKPSAKSKPESDR